MREKTGVKAHAMTPDYMVLRALAGMAQHPPKLVFSEMRKLAQGSRTAVTNGVKKGSL